MLRPLQAEHTPEHYVWPAKSAPITAPYSCTIMDRIGTERERPPERQAHPWQSLCCRKPWTKPTLNPCIAVAGTLSKMQCSICPIAPTCVYIYTCINTHIYKYMYIHICIYIHVQIIYIWSRPPSLHPPAPPLQWVVSISEVQLRIC